MMQNSIDLFLFKEWLRDFRRLSESSIYSYYLILKKFFMECTDLEDIEQYNWFLARYTHKKRCTHYFSVVKAYLQFKFQNDAKTREEWIDKLLKPKRFKNIKIERKYLPDEKLIEIINKIKSDKHRVMALIQVLTAIRAGDVLSLRRDRIFEEVYNDKPTIRLVVNGKGDKRNVVYLFDLVGQEVLKRYLAQYDKKIKQLKHIYYDNFVFQEYGTHGGRVGTEDSEFLMQHMNYLRYWHDVRQAIEISGVVDKKFFSTHDFRRCFARNVWEKYKDVDLLKRALNHEDASTTLRYLRQSGLQNIDIFQEMQD